MAQIAPGRTQLSRWIPLLAATTAVALLLAGLLLIANNETAYRHQTANEAAVQARIVAASVTAALAFDDRATAREYVTALRANPEVQAAGVYGQPGQLVAGYVRSGLEHLPPHPPAVGARFANGRIQVVTPVAEGSTRLGFVYLSVNAEPFNRRAARYGVIALLAVLTSLVLVILALAQRATSAANRDLSAANAQLRVEMAEREKAEAALRQSQKMEAMGQLTGGVAHDFNNLLMIASGGLEMMDRTPDPARRERMKDAVRQALDRGAGLTQQLLAFSRKAPLRAEVIDLGARIRGMRVLLERTLREDIKVEFRIARDLWPVEVDVGQLEVVLLNLAVNSRDAMPDGGLLTVAAENLPGGDAALPGDHVRLWVADTGAGIAAEMIPRVFEPFFTTKGVGQGTGLGLSQVYGFARGSGGDVRVESEVGVGTTVSLLLPRSPKPLPEAAKKRTTKTPKPRAGTKVLLVEDDEGVAAAVVEMLQSLGYEVLRAANAAAAFDTFQHEAGVDVVFSDMVMPGPMSGIELAREIARRSPETAILLTTGFSEAAAAAAEEGIPLLVKPYGIDDLAEELAAAQAEKARARRTR